MADFKVFKATEKQTGSFNANNSKNSSFKVFKATDNQQGSFNNEYLATKKQLSVKNTINSLLPTGNVNKDIKNHQELIKSKTTIPSVNYDANYGKTDSLSLADKLYIGEAQSKFKQGKALNAEERNVISTYGLTALTNGDTLKTIDIMATNNPTLKAYDNNLLELVKKQANGQALSNDEMDMLETAKLLNQLKVDKIKSDSLLTDNTAQNEKNQNLTGATILYDKTAYANNEPQLKNGQIETKLGNRLDLYMNTGFSNFVEGYNTLTDKIIGKTPEEIANSPDSPYALASSALRQYYKENGQDANILVQDTITNMAQNAIPMALSMLGGTVAGGAATANTISRVLSTASFAPSVFGNAYKEGAQSGVTDEGRLLAYSFATTAAECTLEMLLGAEFGQKGILSGEAVSNLSAKVGNVFLKSAFKLAGNGTGEFIEESIQSLLGPLLKEWILGTEEETIFDDPIGALSSAAYEGLIGFVSSMFMSGTSSISEAINESAIQANGKLYNSLARQTGTDIKNIAQYFKEISKSKELTKAAEKVIKGDTSDIAVGELMSQAYSFSKDSAQTLFAAIGQNIQSVENGVNMILSVYEDTVKQGAIYPEQVTSLYATVKTNAEQGELDTAAIGEFAYYAQAYSPRAHILGEVTKAIRANNKQNVPNNSLSDAEQKLINTPDEQLTPEQRAVKESIRERNSSVLRTSSNDAIINNDTNDVGGENDDSTDAEVLAGRRVSAISGNGNTVRQQGENSKKLAELLGRFKGAGQKSGKPITAGESGFLSIYKGHFGTHDTKTGQESRRFWESHVRNLRGIKIKSTDSAGRTLSEELQRKLSDIAFKDEDGEIISFYHWTDASFDVFEKGDIGFHFGTLDAAWAIQFDKSKDNSGYFKEVFLNIKNPVFLEADPMKWTALSTTEYLCRAGVFTDEDFNYIQNYDPESFNKKEYNSKSLNAVRELLQKKGYDGIIYTNDWEGGLSAIALYPEQIITIAENGILKENCGVTENNLSDIGTASASDTDYELSDNDMYSKDPSQWSADNKNDTTVSKSLKDKLKSLFGKGSSENKITYLSEIVKLIEKEFAVPVSKGKFRQKAYGIYKNHSQAIRTKVSNALPTIAHELGHHIDNKHNLRNFESIGEAERVLKETRPDFYNSYKPTARPREAVAEFMRDYLADRKLAKEKYPFFFEEFERKLSETEQGKTDLENLKVIGDKINEYYNAELRERAKAAIISRKEAKRIERMSITLDDILTKAETDLLDDGAVFKTISQKAYDLYYWAKKSSVRAKNTLTGYYMAGFKEGIVRQRDKDGNIMKDENGNELYVPALKFILSEIESGTMFDDFNDYLVCRHGVEWLKQDLRVYADDALNTKSYITGNAEYLEKKYPHFKETAENLYEWYRTFVYEYGVESGLMTKEQYKALVEKYPCYVPFMRNVKKKKKRYSKSGVANQNAPLNRAKGSGLEIYTPIESLVIKVEQFMKAADRNAVMQEIADTVDVDSGFGWLLEEVPPDMIPNTISRETVKNATKKNLSNNGMDESVADELSNLIDTLIGESITEFKINYNQGENVVAVRRNGKRTLYQVHDENLLAAVTGLNPDQFGKITKAFGSATRLFKALTTGGNAVWSLVSNAPRDFDAAYKYGSENNPIKYTVDYIKAVASQFGTKDSEVMKLYRTLGGGYNNSFANARELRLTTKELFRRDKNIAVKIKAWFNIVENVTKLADFIETAPRLAEFKRVFERTSDAKKAMLAAEEITVNFNRSGKFTKTLDQYIPYLNASLQANAKFAKAMANSLRRDGDRSFLIKSIVTGIIKTGFMFGILGLFGDEGEEEYEKLSSYKKNNFYNIYLGDGKFVSIPKSQATGVFDSLLERTFEIACKENVDWGQEIKDFGGYMWLTFGPPLVDDMIIGSTVLELAKNEDFTGAPIVPSYYEDLEPEMQFNEKTTYIAKAIGQLFGWSPMKIDHIIESNFGYFGLLNKSLGRDEKDFTLGTKTKVIADSAYSTDVLNNFYDKADDYASKAKSYSNNAEYVYKNEQYTAIKSVVSALNGYGKEDPAVAREFKILARDYVDKFEKDSNVNKKLLALLDRTGEEDILYYRTFKPTYSINKVEYKMESNEFMNFVDEYYKEVEKEYEEIFNMKLSDETTVRLLINAKETVYKRVAVKYKYIR